MLEVICRHLLKPAVLQVNADAPGVCPCQMGATVYLLRTPNEHVNACLRACVRVCSAERRAFHDRGQHGRPAKSAQGA